MPRRPGHVPAYRLHKASGQARVIINCADTELSDILEQFGLEQFAAVCIASEVKLERTSGETIITAEKSSYQKCQRCWNYLPNVGANSEKPDMCERCIETIYRTDE